MLQLLLAAGLAAGLPLAQPAGNTAPAAPAEASGATPAPAFMLEEPDGTVHSLQSFRGEVVLVMFWVSWADNCVHMGDAHLSRIHKSLHDAGKPFRVVLIGGAHDDHAMQQQMLASDHGWPFLLLGDPDHAVTKSYGAESWGWLALIDESGNLVASGSSHSSLGEMEAWLSQHFDVTIATADHGNGEDASVVMITVVVVLALLVLATTRKRNPEPAATPTT